MSLTLKKSRYGSKLGFIKIGSAKFHSIGPDNKGAKMGLVKLLDGATK